MTVFPIAKINLGLNVIGKRPDGYHDLETVFWPVDITDILTIDLADEEDVPTEDNLVTKAYRLLQKYHEIPPLKITLEKRIPMQAGMGGGSSDAAYTLKGINELCHLGITTEQLQRYASMLGADCAMFITAETAYATGIGDILTPLEPHKELQDKWLLLVKPDAAISTKEAYAGITPKKPQHNCRDIVVNEPVEKWRNYLHNDFEDSIFPKLPILRDIKDSLYADGALYASMSGSGSTIYGIFNHKIEIKKYAKYYNKILTF